MIAAILVNLIKINPCSNMHILKNIDCTKCSMSGYLINGIIEGLFHNSLPSCPSCVI